MQRFPFLSITDALGLAPPREEPGIRSSLISLKDASSSMIFSDAANNFGKSTNGGIAFLSFAVKKSPSGVCLNRKAP